MSLNPEITYTVSYPKVRMARAKNKCQVCKRFILKGEKYLFCLFVDDRRIRLRYSMVGFHVQMKYCRECAIELLRLKSSNLLIRPNHEKRVLEALGEMLHKRDRFTLLREMNPLQEYLKEKSYPVKSGNDSSL